jgi:uncharacterized membrane protein
MELKGKELYGYTILNMIMLIVAVTGLIDAAYLNYKRNYLLYILLVLVAVVMLMDNVTRIKAKTNISLSILFLIVELVYIIVLAKFWLF